MWLNISLYFHVFSNEHYLSYSSFLYQQKSKRQNDAYVWIYHYFSKCLKIWYFHAFLPISASKDFKYSILRIEGIAAWCLRIKKRQQSTSFCEPRHWHSWLGCGRYIFSERKRSNLLSKASVYIRTSWRSSNEADVIGPPTWSPG